MKVSMNWVQEYLDFALPPLDELVDKIGAQLGAVEEVIDLREQYKGIVIVHVVTCEKMEASDHLNICKVDDGGVIKDVERDENGYVQVVTGAPNIHADMFVPWLPPGTIVPSSFHKEPFLLEARKLLGALSSGMMASAKELAIGDSHEGILELEPGPELNPGADFAEVYGLNDYIIDIENKMFTHRPDCFGILGVAREIAGILGHDFTSPAIYSKIPALEQAVAGEWPLEVINEIPELVPRIIAQVFSNITIKPSPLRIQTYLSRVGIRPINSIVDITNYFMVLTGQPLHAYDYDKVRAMDPESDHATIVVRFPHSDEKLRLLNSKEITPRSEAIIIATTTKAVGLGGAMGGQDTEVDYTTKHIILECATFDMYSIRRTSMAHGVFTDAVSRFNKGQSPLQNDHIVAWATKSLLADCGATSGQLVDNNNLPESIITRDSLYPSITIAAQFINQRLGFSLRADEMAALLRHVEFAVVVKDDQLVVTPPFWRTDIELREDIIEEIGRLYGFDALPLHLPKRDLTPAHKNDLLELKNKIRISLAKAGANEVLTYSFVHGKLLDAVTQKREQAFKLTNALSPELQYYRLHALPSLLDKVHMNIKAGYDEFALFELNKGHNLLHKDDANDGIPTEFEFLDFVYASSKKQPGAAFYRARRFLDDLARDFGLTLSYKAVVEDPHVPVADPYDYTRSAYVSIVSNGEFLGMVGELKPSILKKLKLPAQTAVFTIGPTLLNGAIEYGKTLAYNQLPKFPKVEQDICLRVDTKLDYQELRDFVEAEINKAKPDQTLSSLGPVDIYQRKEDVEHKQITFRMTIASYERTLTDQEVAKILDKVALAAKDKFAAERV
jgi:phenylalanyl-tRNA synthetase beta chain